MARTIQTTKKHDGGFGWVIVAAAFMMHVLADGILFTLGVLYTEFLAEFKQGKGETAWINSLIPGTMLTIGPIIGALTSRFGCRVVPMVGAAIAATGFGISFFGKNIYALYFTFGVFSGVGFGCIFLPTIVCVGQYFEKKRSFAIGLAMCGAGVGTFVFAPIVTYLVDEYGWRGATLIEAGIALNMAVCGALFRPFYYKVTDDDSIDQTNVSTCYQTKPDCNNSEDKEMDIVLIQESKEEKITNRMIDDDSIDQTNVSTSYQTKPDCNNFKDKEMEIVLTPESKEEKITNRMIDDDSIDQTNVSTSYQTKPDCKEKITDRTNCGRLMYQCERHFEFKLFKNPVFLIFTASNLCTAIGFNVPYVYLIDRAEEKGISKTDSAFLISVIGITNTIGRIIFGWIADHKWANRLLLYSASLIICGVVNILNPLTDSYVYLMGYSAIFGAFIGVTVSLNSVLLVDFLGIHMLDKALGLLMLFHGIGTFVGPPIAGWLYDGTGNYNVSFYFIGALMVLSGVLLVLIPVYNKTSNKKDVSTNQNETSEMKRIKLNN